MSATGPGIVVIDKPAGMTSHDVVGRCRRIFATRRVGHAGTLDPMATGVLVIGIERATKILGLLTAAPKSYAATIRLGQTTSTEDAEGQVLQSVPAKHLTIEAIDAAMERLRGEIRQVPSSVSAIKVGGRRAYRLARQGRSVQLEARPIRIDRFELLAARRRDQLIDIDVEIDCSSGTYIRALARDLGDALGVGGHVTALRRTRVGRFEVVVAAHDLRPGTALTPGDVRLEKRSATTLPDGSQADLDAVVGSTLASPTRRGEVLTDVRLLGSRLAESTAGPDARIVPLHLADSALVDLVRVGDVVDVLAAPVTDSPAALRLLATDAIVVLVSAQQKAQAADSDRVVLVALPARLANTVAGAALGQTVTLTLH